MCAHDSYRATIPHTLTFVIHEFIFPTNLVDDLVGYNAVEHELSNDSVTMLIVEAILL